ncbi:restriction endonuclease subunit S [Bradyrhizobium oligotrophicum]|uniref:restriction endonuclease subunit S n=1 Tax=Bradyrhizobium oligotrophicum TaxID=44255 RepID=UPI003EBCF2D2
MSLPNTWAKAPLSDITPSDAPILYGILQPGPEVEGGVPYVRPTEIENGGIKVTELRKTSTSISKQYTRSTLKAGDIILSIVGTIGKVATVPLELDGGNITQSSCRIRVDSELASTPFVSYFLRSNLATSQYQAKRLGTAVPRLNIADIRQFSIGLAPLPEQRRIVAKLDALLSRLARAREEVDRVTNLAEQARDRAKASAFLGELTRADRKGEDTDWPESRLDEVSDVVTGSTPPTADRERYFGGDLPFFKPTDLDAGYFVRVPRETLTAEGATRARVVPAGATLVTCIGATIAKAGLARVACAFNQQINAAAPKTEIVNPKWLYWAITSPQFRNEIVANSSATTMPIINKGRFQALRLRIPPLWEQTIIVERLEAIHSRADRLEAEAARARALLDRLEAAILTKAFKGELVPQDPNDEPASVLLERIRAQRAAVAKEPRQPRGRRAAASRSAKA